MAFFLKLRAVSRYMNHQTKEKVIQILLFIVGTILVSGIILCIDFLYAGVQEHFLSNFNPDYVPDRQLANQVIIGSSLGFVAGLIIYILLIRWQINAKKLREKLASEEFIDEDERIDFNLLQEDISFSIKILRDLFGFLVVTVILTGAFNFFRFIWMIGQYRLRSEFFIHHFLGNISSIVISVTIYITLGIMIHFIVSTSLQKYYRLKIISDTYDAAMLKVWENYGKLMNQGKEENNNKQEK
jgi:hypothetical protein